MKALLFFLSVMVFFGCRKPVLQPPVSIVNVPDYPLKDQGGLIFSLDSRPFSGSTMPLKSALAQDSIIVTLEVYNSRKLDVIKTFKVPLRKINHARYAVQIDITENQITRVANVLFDEQYRAHYIINDAVLPVSDVPWGQSGPFEGPKPSPTLWGYNIWYGDLIFYTSNAGFLRLALSK